MDLMRGPLLADDTLKGQAWCRAHSELVDAWLADLLRQAEGSAAEGIALVAVGGYGRSELCPQSDIDVMLVHDRRPSVAEVADRIWYPVWDQGLHLGHSVCTVREALTLASDDLDTATALLSARHVAGDPALTSELAVSALSQWRNRSKRALNDLAGRVEERHRKAGEVAFGPEPDLKEGRGGLRDVHALWWGEAARHILLDEDAGAIGPAYATLLDVRVELQRVTGRPSNVLALEEQPHVSAALGEPDASTLMARVAEAARTVAWTSDDCWRRLRSAIEHPLGRIGSRARVLGPGVVEKSGEVVVSAADPALDPVLILRAAAAAASLGTVIERRSLERLAADAPAIPNPWPTEARERLLELLLAGTSAVRVVEALDQRGVWSGVLPEWTPVRALPQPETYHAFTVDRHLLETAAYAAARADRVSRPDLLVMASLLHDIGKGNERDHATVGAEVARRVAIRMGFPDPDAATLGALVEHHLLLRDVAARRDIHDPATVELVATAVGSRERLELLAELTEADARATGPGVWNPAQVDLMRQLVGRVQRRLDGDDAGDPGAVLFPTPDQLARLAAWGQHFEVHDGTLTVMTSDRPGVFSRVAGVLALHGLDVLSAAAHSTDDGRALAEFRVTDPFRDETPWSRVLADLELALDGRLALQARITARARTYGRRKRSFPVPQIASVSFDDHASAQATVIDVRVDDGIGVLYRITRALAELDLDIRSAKVQTLGDHVHDAFYVRDRRGKITDPRMRGEIEQAILHSLAG
jgi:[protein-PII] uridylyltransferase